MGANDAIDVIREIGQYLPQMTEWRRHIHANPETAFEEVGTARYVAERLRRSASTRSTKASRDRCGGRDPRWRQWAEAIGLRADMDALDMQEVTGVPWQSTRRQAPRLRPRRPHRHAARRGAPPGGTRHFDGTVYVIFQPAEENEGGGRVMVEEGLFERFPMKAVFGMHNIPGIEAGKIAVKCRPDDGLVRHVRDHHHRLGAHGAMPHKGIDPIVIGAELTQKLQTIVSRNVDPHRSGRAVGHQVPLGLRLEHHSQRGGAGRHRARVQHPGAGSDRAAHPGAVRGHGRLAQRAASAFATSGATRPP
jgi:metal-dependent amidase/aminoacylase/carboxypeptidase family protein